VWRIERPEDLKGRSRKKREEKRRGYKSSIAEDLIPKTKRREERMKTRPQVNRGRQMFNSTSSACPSPSASAHHRPFVLLVERLIYSLADIS